MATPEGADGPLFRALPPEETGIDFVSFLKRPHHVPFLNTGSGVAVGDVDGDELPDLYLVSTDSPNRLYRQVAPFRFEDVTAEAGVDGGPAWSRGAVFADVDGDGDLDLYVCNTEAPNLLYLNDGRGRFEEAAARFGLDVAAASIMAYFADYDRDGDLDLYLLTYRVLQHRLTDGQIADIEVPNDTLRTIEELRVPPVRGRREGDRLVSFEPDQWIDLGTGDWELSGQRDRLFRNDGDGRFTDVTEKAGLLDYGLGLSTVWMDFDGDGWLDLYVANDLTTRDRLYANRRDGTFEEVLADTLPHTTWFSMGSDFADVDNDGHLDLFVADMAGSTHYRAKVGMGDMSSKRGFLMTEWPRQAMRNALFLGTGSERYLEAAHLAGVSATDWTWAVRFGDLDNDGRVDLFATNGTSRDDLNLDVMGIKFLEIEAAEGEAAALEYLKTIPTAPSPNHAFRNLGDLAFEKSAARWGLDHDGISFGAALADLDRDGDLDLVVNHLGEPAGIYRNRGTAGHRALVRLRGRSNRFGLGATVRLSSPTAGEQVRVMLPARGFMSADEPVVHFGLGEDARIDRLEVAWPSGHTQSFEDLAAGQLFTVTEPDGPAEPVTAPGPPPTQFAEATAELGLDFRHRETFFDDYAKQPLLPYQLSQLGPGVACGDADGDGDEDLFVGGAAGQAGRLYLAEEGRFSAAPSGPWEADGTAEDMAPLWLDADGDGDLDLFVASGGVEAPEGDPRLADRLYLNGGDAGFTRAGAGALPTAATSSSAAAAADFDGDGDLDLFVGGRVVPGRYPLAPASRLLRNEGGRFADVTDALAPELRAAGLVTSALWSDADDDGRVDLLLTVEWGPVRFFRNTGSGLVERTREAGLSERLGWWSSIVGGDFDRDGRIDYAVMNQGLNSKYHASPDHPAVLYYGDMDGSGVPQLVEAKSGDHELLPVRGRSCSSEAMPFVAEKFPTFHDFASASLPEIYPRETLAEAVELRATELASGVLFADDAGGFTWQPLPRRAQISPGYGAAVGDFDGDGLPDLYAVQNFFTREPETGVERGGLSAMLRGDGEGGLRWQSPRHTGLLVAGDAKGLAVGDFDGDGRPDLVVAQNDGPLLAFANRGGGGGRPFAVRLRGDGANPAAVGARVVAVGADGRRTAAEIYAGSGYLSQSAPVLFFGRGAGPSPARLEVRWPDGRETVHSPDPDAEKVVLRPDGTTEVEAG